MTKAKEAFRTISEVAEWLDTPTHVLRFWETKFSQIRPVKGAGGRRYYRPSDMDLLGGIKQLLHEDGMTIKGTQKLLREKGVKHVASLGASVTVHDTPVLPDTITGHVPAPAPDPVPHQAALPLDIPAAAIITPAPPPVFDAPPAGLPDIGGRLIGRAPVKAAVLRQHLTALVPLVARLQTMSDRFGHP